MPDDFTVCVGAWRFQVSGDTAYVVHSVHPGDVQIKADAEKFNIEVFDDSAENLKAKLSVPYEVLGPLQEDR